MQEPDVAPLAVRLSGPFSADVWINGGLAGSKGRPAPDARGEIPGPIDALVPAGHLLMAGENEILLRISSHRTGYVPARLIQDFDLVPRTGPARRDLTHYLPALLQAGLTVILLLVSAGLALRRDGPGGTAWSALAAFCLLGALGAETGRSFINYAYPWHGVRVGAIALAHAGFALSLTLAAGRVVQNVAFPWHRGAAAVAGIFLVGLALTLTLPGLGGLDTAARVALAAGFSAAAWHLSRGETIQTALATGACLVGAGLAALAGRTFLDNGIYALGPIVLLLLLFAGAPSVTGQNNAPLLRLPGLARAVSFREVVYLQARGNYVEIHLRDGAAHLVRASLAEVVEAARARLIRIHRSYAVNPDRALKVDALEGSRYRLVLDTGDMLPVSRSQAADLRTQLAAAPRQS